MERTITIGLRTTRAHGQILTRTSLGTPNSHQQLGVPAGGQHGLHLDGFLVHVGDSRAYLMRDGELNQITHDDTFVQTLIDDGRITEEEANSHPQRSLLPLVVHALLKGAGNVFHPSRCWFSGEIRRRVASNDA